MPPYQGMLLAPMAGITDWPMRLICKRMGCSFAYTEMVSAKGLSYGNRSQSYLDTHPEEGRAGAQIFGSDPAIMADIARRIEGEWGASIAEININMGCPAPKIVRNGEGSALLQDLPLAGRIMEAVASATQLPVSVKYRRGFRPEDDVSAEMARIAEQSGMAMICVHGRTTAQGYSGRADWGCVAAAKRACKLPVVGNGDIDSPAMAERMQRETGCDAVMIGRAAVGNPWIFRAAPNAGPPSHQEIYDVAMEHLDMEIEYRGERFAIPHLRKVMSAYTAGLPGAAAHRRDINAAQTRQQLRDLFTQALNI